MEDYDNNKGLEEKPVFSQEPSVVFNPEENQQKKETASNRNGFGFSKKMIALIAIIVAAVIVLLVVIPIVSISVEDLCKEGKYAEALKKADEDDKYEIIGVYATAAVSSELSKKLRDPSSFVLRDGFFCGYIDDEDNTSRADVVIHSSGKNGFGGTTSDYFYYKYDEYDGWTYVCSCNDFEPVADYDDGDMDKLIEAASKILIMKILNNENTIIIKDFHVKNINNLFKEEMLDDIEDIDIPVVGLEFFEDEAEADS